MNPHPAIFIYCALPCEAKPAIEHFRLKKEIRVRPFAVYRRENLCLTVTGLGKQAMAAAVGYTQALLDGGEHPVLINLGIAGHRTRSLGTPLMAHKITDAETGKNHYPVPAYAYPCASAAVLTTSRPQLDYAHDDLCDMEASAFYETAIRFSTGELVQCLKIVSDNAAAPADGLESHRVTDFIGAHLDKLAFLIEELGNLALSITSDPCADFDRLVELYRFSVSERTQLQHLLAQRKLLSGESRFEFGRASVKKGKDVLRLLQREIDATDITL
ncbi:MAG: hypothetical protein ACU84J_03725 [Gammaproteobacteria bacterium]